MSSGPGHSTDDPGPRSEHRRPALSIRSTESSALEALLVDLGSQIHRGASQKAVEPLSHCPTGLSALDARLGGGFPRGRLSEICGARRSIESSGRTSLALQLLQETLRRGGLAAWVDWADAFDPASAAAVGSDLDRLLWVRARSADEALRSCERLLQTEGFELVVLDLAFFQGREPSALGASPRGPTRGQRQGPARDPISDVAWLRLARLAAGTRTALVALSNASTTGSRAELVLEMQPLQARFVGPPSLLERLETTVVIQRHRTRPIGQEVPLSIDAEPEEDTAPDRPPDRRGPRTAR